MLEKLPSDVQHVYQYTLPESRREGAMWLHWLTRLRWIAITAQAVVLAFTWQTLATPVALAPMAAAIAVLMVANFRARRRLTSRERVPRVVLLHHLTLDVLVLTVLFALAGGPANPFTYLYLVHVAMGMIMLPAGHAVVLTIVIACAYATLHAGSLPLHYDQHWIPAAVLQPLGQILAFTITVVTAGGFVLGMANSLRRHQQREREQDTLEHAPAPQEAGEVVITDETPAHAG